MNADTIIPFIKLFQFIFKSNIINFYSTIATYLYHQELYDLKKEYFVIDLDIDLDIDIEIHRGPQKIVYSIVNSIVSISSIEPCYYKYSIPFHLCKMFNVDEVIPIGVDTLFYFSFDAIIIYFMFVFCTKIKPFHKLNPIVVYLLLTILRQYSGQ
jgi:hypothetical protein